MIKAELFSMQTAFRGEHCIYGYHFGQGEKAACIVGAMRGNEYQQLYICSLLSSKLAELEASGNITNGKEILLIPCLNSSAMNANHKLWLSDDSDINREFPGNPAGTATSRIAFKTLDVSREYQYGIHFPSFYLPGMFIPHVRILETGRESVNLANLFGLQCVLLSEPKAYDLHTLNYNWQQMGTEAFSIYSGGTDHLNQKYAEIAVSAVLRFLSRMGIIKYNNLSGYISEVMNENEMTNIKADDAGFLRRYVGANEEVRRGQKLADIVDPMDGKVRSEVIAPADGIIFFVQDEPMISQNVTVFKLIRRLHK